MSFSNASSPARNNYAAPNTPIASSKRARVVVKDSSSSLTSPIKGKNGCVANNLRVTAVEDQRKISPDMHGASPSKNLFSPTLRYDEIETSATTSDDFSTTPSSTPSRDEPKVQVHVEEEEDDDVFNPYQFISSLPPHEAILIRNKICLPPNLNSSLMTLALDLDETLVHCTIEPISNPDIIFPVKFNDMNYQVYVRKRPYLDLFLETVSKLFEVVVFTASQKVYADTLLNIIDPDHRFINHRLFREACVLVQGNYLKDITVLGRDLQRTVLVDNSPHAYGYQIDNGVPIESWFDDSSDTELLKLATFLKRIVDVEDVRPVIREHFKTYQLVGRAKIGQPVSLSAPPF